MKARILALLSLITVLALLVLGRVSPMAAQTQLVAPVSASNRAEVAQIPQSAPLMFIENVGQFASDALFRVYGGGYGLWLAEDALWFTMWERPQVNMLQRQTLPTPERFNALHKDKPRKGVNLRLSFIGANPQPRLEPFDRLETVVSYFIGNNPNKWYPDVPVWGGVRYRDLYPSIDLEITSQDSHWAWRIAARDGADLSAVRLRVEGVDTLTLDDNWLDLTTALGNFTLPLPIADWSGPPTTIKSRDVLYPFYPTNRLPAHQITPQGNPSDLLYGTFLGGEWGDVAESIAVDSWGNAYVTGWTNWHGGSDFPTTPGSFDTTHNGGDDAFVVKLNPSGSDLVYATFLGGSDDERSHAITVDEAGNAYVTGETYSPDFPTTPDAFDTSYNTGYDAFVVKLNPSGSDLVYATFLGSGNYDFGYAIAVNTAGNAYVTGYTYLPLSYSRPPDFPTTPDAFDTTGNGYDDAFVVKLNPSGSDLVYATFLGGSGWDYGRAIAVDGTGNAYVTGETESHDFPTTPDAFDTTGNGYYDAFVVKLNPSGSDLVYATFLGGRSDDRGYDIAVDAAGNAYVTGQTNSPDFPTTSGAFDTSGDGYTDAFVVKLNPSGSDLVYATFLGGSGAVAEPGRGIAVDGWGNAYVTGSTFSSDFPTTPDAFDTTYNNGWGDAFVSKLNATGSDLVYSTFLGGSFGHDCGNDIAVDGVDRAYVVGATGSPYFPTTPDAFDTTGNGHDDAFVVKLAVGGGEPPCDLREQPILFVHGWHASATSLRTDDQLSFFIDYLGPDYAENCNLWYAQGVSETTPLHQNAERIQASLREAYDHISYWDPSFDGHFDIIAHSMGGINARAYLESDLYKDDQNYKGRGIHVDNLFTLGTPHGGAGEVPTAQLYALATRWKELLGDLPSIIELSIPHMALFNLMHDQPDNVCYRLLGGDIYEQLPFLSVIWPFPNDLLVSQVSAHSLGYFPLSLKWPKVVKEYLPDMHGYTSDLSFLRSYVQPRDTFDQCIKDFIGVTGASCPGASATTLEAPATITTPTSSPMTPFVTGVITTGQSVTGTLAIDTSEHTAFYLAWYEGDLDFTLVAPDSTVINTTTAKTDPNVSFLALDALVSTEIYVITDTLPGTWTFTVTAVTSPHTMPYAVYAVLDTPINLTLPTNAEWYPSGSPAVITATLMYSATALTDATVQVEVSRPDGATQTIALLDDGAHNDGVPSDGIYGGVYFDTIVGGYYSVIATASGNYLGQDYQRAAQTIFTVSPGTASLSGTYADYPEDNDGDGLYEHLAVDVDVSVSVSGDYNLSAVLEGVGEKFISHAMEGVTLTVGSQVVTLEFDGDDIRDSGLNGPYTVTEVLLLDESEIAVKLDEAHDVWTTAAYDHRQFGNGLKAVAIVGDVESLTSSYKANMNDAVDALQNHGVSVAKFYYGDTRFTWLDIVAAAQGAHFLLYMGHGVYQGSMPYPSLVGGFYLGDGQIVLPDHVRHFLDGVLAPDSIIIFSNTCFTAGSASGDPFDLPQSEAERRVKMYAEPFTDIGMEAYFANNHFHSAERTVNLILDGYTMGDVFKGGEGHNADSFVDLTYPKMGYDLWLDGNPGDWDLAFVGIPEYVFQVGIPTPTPTYTPTPSWRVYLPVILRNR